MTAVQSGRGAPNGRPLPLRTKGSSPHPGRPRGPSRSSPGPKTTEAGATAGLHALGPNPQAATGIGSMVTTDSPIGWTGSSNVEVTSGSEKKPTTFRV